MSELTRLLSAVEQGDAVAAGQLLPLVDDELRRLAAQNHALEKPGQTRQATAVVHEAYLRLVDADRPQHWDGRRHFFAAAAEAMRRLLVEAARRKGRLKPGGGLARDAAGRDVAGPERPGPVLAVDEAVDRLAATSPQAAELVKLRYFAGLSNAEAPGEGGRGPRRVGRAGPAEPGPAPGRGGRAVRPRRAKARLLQSVAANGRLVGAWRDGRLAGDAELKFSQVAARWGRPRSTPGTGAVLLVS
jgi:RNA polymerase sigma factor (TIGR02999 family)